MMGERRFELESIDLRYVESPVEHASKKPARFRVSYRSIEEFLEAYKGYAGAPAERFSDVEPVNGDQEQVIEELIKNYRCGR